MSETKFWSGTKKNNINAGNSSTIKKAGKGLGIGLIILIIIAAILGGVVFVYVVRPGYVLLDSIKTLEEDSQRAQQALIDRDLVELADALDKTEADLNNLREVRNSNFPWAADFGPTQVYYKDSDHFIDAGLHMVEAGREAIVLAEPFADAGGFRISEEQEQPESVSEDAVSPEDTGLAEAVQAWLQIMPEVADNLDGVLVKLDQAGQEMQNVDPNNYPEEFRGTPVRPTIVTAQTTLTQLTENADDIKLALRTLPELMGVGTTEKRYMIIMQNDKEIRATGGFWTYIATFKLDDGLLSSDFTSYNSYYVDDVLNEIDAFHTFPTVPESYEKYLRVERLFARDANISPDLPTAVDLFMTEFWDLANVQRPAELKPVDGVVVIDTQVLEELMEITGPVTVNGFTYNSDNVVLELERIASLALAEQIGRKRILGDMMEEMLKNVFESDKNLWPVMVDKGVDLAMRKHISGVVLENEDAQYLLDKYNFSNRIIDPIDGDYAYIVQTNLGGDKTNWFVDKEVTHELTREGEDYIRTISIKYNYTRPSEEYSPFIKRFRDWVRIYVPAGSELISFEGSEDTTGEGEERNKTYYHGYIELGPDEEKTMTLRYRLPEGVVEGDTYNLYIQKQAGIDNETHYINIEGQTQEILLNTDEEVSIQL